MVEPQVLVELIRASAGDDEDDDVGRRLVVLPAFETLPFKSDGNLALDDLTHRVADFAQAAHKDDLQVGCTTYVRATTTKYVRATTRWPAALCEKMGWEAAEQTDTQGGRLCTGGRQRRSAGEL